MLKSPLKQNALFYCILIGVLLICRGMRCTKGDDSCADGGKKEYIKIVNNSDDSVNWQSEDTRDSIWINRHGYAFSYEKLIPPDSTYRLWGCWDYTYKQIKSRYYFIYSHDTVKAIGWNGINGTYRGLLKKVYVDIDYLKKNNYTITYP